MPRDQMDPKYICRECRNIMTSPVKCQKCQVQCCMECSGQVCNSFTLCDHYFSAVNQELKKEVQGMYVKCKYNLQGCLKMSRLRDLESHQKECEFSRFSCNKEDCVKQQKVTKTTSHLTDCPYSVMQCAKCQKQMRRLEQVSHDCVKWLLSINENVNVQNDV